MCAPVKAAMGPMGDGDPAASEGATGRTGEWRPGSRLKDKSGTPSTALRTAP
jgi:hypothetical protein